ncbi:lutropin-choriogonadotropic hormone receptor-like [Adelges cooleyi]|uniref:lutropin-choriogonadotropic hormone receptor-like n=1 Tax=Adelges cooleyi TaxID=133065 RepID=UPI00217F94B1|nr:lutropin-choriogonadotropic hormone receptor-like [Adelges cooleyi]
MATTINIVLWSICLLLSIKCNYTISTVEHSCFFRNITNQRPEKKEMYCFGVDKIPIFNEPVHVITLRECNIKELSENSFSLYKHSITDIVLINVKNLATLSSSTFKNLTRLQSLFISHAISLKEIPSDVFRSFSKSFSSLHITKSNLKKIPDLSNLGSIKAMHTIEFEGNNIHKLTTNGIKTRTEQLLLEYNGIEEIENWAFNGSEIAKLSLKGNKLRSLFDHSFDGIANLLSLDLSETSMSFLPASGLMSIEKLWVEKTTSLTKIPSIYSFGNLKEAHLTYSFHCCAFQFPDKHDHTKYANHQANIQAIQNKCEGSRTAVGVLIEHPTVTLKTENAASDNNDNEEFFHETAQSTNNMEIVCGNITPITQSPVKCSPQPDALNPCEDIMGFFWLRMSVWIVGVTALLGNMIVLLVVIRKRANKSVPRFLMSNLAFADFCTAIYLLILAYQDFESSNKYFNYAYNWQTGVGCKIGGFLTVFSSQLSVFALCLLTIERWFSIRRALYTNKLTFSSAAKLMAIGWTYSLFMAALPLMGVSSYSTTSICLPIDVSRVSSVCYILTLVLFAGGAFVLMAFCYAQIYSSLSYETRHAKGEACIARKILILVGTNFVCTAPVIFFAVTALLGLPLVDVTQSKILLVFFYPINSCANPFLYTILTASFRHDIVSTFTKFGFCGNGDKKKYKVIFSTQTNNTNRVTPVHCPESSSPEQA